MLCVRQTIVVCLVAVLTSGVAAAQESRGKILGRVIDSTGALIPGAEIIGVHTETNTRTTARSNEAGNYELPYLLPGIYRIEVTATGFKQYVRQPIEVRVGDTITLDINMVVGQVTEKIDVVAEAPLLESASASMSSTMDHRQLADLPMGGGDVMFLTQLAPGVTTAQAPGHNWLPSATDVMSNVTVAGTRNGNSDFSLDGIANMTRARVSFAPPGDMVQEFRVHVVNYDASIGHAAGGSVNMSLKAGGNPLHGTAEWAHAPNPWQANDFFTNKQIYDLSSGPVTEEKKKRLAPPRMVNRYSATASGPVYLPKLYDGRNRTFWTYGFQGFNRRNPNNAYYTAPTAAERQGDFSALLAVGKQYQIYDPATIATAPGGRTSRQLFANNIIPTARLDAIAQNYLKFYPLPNVAGTADGRNNYQVTSANSNDFIQNMARVDHNFSDRHRFFGRFTHSWLHFYRGDFYNNQVRGLSRLRKQRGVGLDDVYTVSPSMVVNLKYGFTRFLESDFPYTMGYDLAGLGLPATLISQLDPQGVKFPRITIDGFAQLGEATNSQTVTNYHNLSGSVSKMHGNHSTRWGGEYRLMRENDADLGDGTPTIDFTATWTRGPLDNSPTAPLGQGLASFVLGRPTGGGLDRNASYAQQSTFSGLFIQDDWKVRRKLTVNVGLRWEYESAPTERFNRSVRGYDFSQPNPISAAALAAYAANPIPELPVSAFKTMGGLTFVGQDGRPRGLWETGKKNLAPRIGLAYQITPKTVVRSGYGIFYAMTGIDQNAVNQAGFSQRTSLIPSNDNGLTFRATLANPFPDGVLNPSPVGITTYLGRAITFFSPHRPNPYNQRWSFSLQRELPGRSLVEISYIGNRGTRLNIQRAIDVTPRQYLSASSERDQAAIDFLSAQVPNPFFGFPEFAGSGITGRTMSRGNLLRPYPHFNGMTAPNPGGFSWYHALTVRAEKRFTRGYMFTASYTWSKFMEAVEYLNDTDPGPTHVISPQDRPRRLVVTSIWELPFGKGKRLAGNAPGVVNAVIGGWQVQAIFLGQNGAPIAFGNVLFRGAGPEDLRKLVLPVDQRTPDRWFNTLISTDPGVPGFEANSTRTLANNLRTFPLRLSGLRADGDNYWNAALYKQFAFKERYKMQLRTEWEGALNHPQFAAPNAAPTNTLFGKVSGIRGEARRIFVGLKLTF